MNGEAIRQRVRAESAEAALVRLRPQIDEKSVGATET